MIQKQRGPGGNRGHAPAGELSAWESYRTRALAAVLGAQAELSDYADSTDEPAPSAVKAADLLDAACVALGGAS